MLLNCRTKQAVKQHGLKIEYEREDASERGFRDRFHLSLAKGAIGRPDNTPLRFPPG